MLLTEPEVGGPFYVFIIATIVILKVPMGLGTEGDGGGNLGHESMSQTPCFRDQFLVLILHLAWQGALRGGRWFCCIKFKMSSLIS